MPRSNTSVSQRQAQPRREQSTPWLKALWGRLTLRRAKPQHTLLAASSTDLSDRLIAHQSEYQALQHVASTFNVPMDRMSKAYALAAEARSLAFEISLIPGFDSNPLLQNASASLQRHWRCAWTNSGVSEAQYRLAIKTVLLYLQRTAALRAIDRAAQSPLPMSTN